LENLPAPVQTGFNDDEQGKSLGEHWAALKRRRWEILFVAAFLFAASLVIALAWPATYRSTATILIQEQDIPPDLVRSTVTGFADERIYTISQQVMTRAVLLDLVEKYGLYPDSRKWATKEELLEKMRRDIKLVPVTADVTNRSGSPSSATIAFKLSYDSESPPNAQRVANDLVSLYLNENIKTRTQQAAETSAFLAEEAQRLAEQIQEIETRLAVFKQRNQGRLPELSEMNMQMIERSDSELMRIDQELSALQDRKVYLHAELSQIKPTAPLVASTGEVILDPAEKLKALEANYAGQSGVYGEDHPDIKRMRREIAALKKETGTDTAPDTKQTRDDLEVRVATLRERYGDDHPDVQRAKKALSAVQNPAGNRSAKAKSAPKPDNPPYIALQAQLESADAEIRSLQAMRAEVRDRSRTYESRLEQMPEVERAYADLTRDHDNAVERYREVKNKQMQADVAQFLEKDRKAERFTLIDPPQHPEKPTSPNRLAILFGGLAISLTGSFSLAFLRETFDHSVKGLRDLVRIAPAPVLSVIPYVEDARERDRRAMHKKYIAIASVAGFVLFLLFIHFFLKPLPVLWYALMRHIGL
jgi:polysaccharide biosynthesis transport protein